MGSSFNPNFIAVDHSSLTPTQVLNQQPLSYTIHFQNTGSAPAQQVVVRDLIHINRLSLSPFQLISSSHPVNVGLEGDTLVFAFDNINLPDSGADFLGSQGYVKFRLTPNANLVTGDEIDNQAAIYFDNNDPVATNTGITTIDESTGLAAIRVDQAVRIYPNPAENLVTISVPQNLTGGEISLFDIQGRKLRSIPVSSTQTLVSLKKLPKGVYVLRYHKNEMMAVERLVKE